MAGPITVRDPAGQECRELVGRILASPEFRRAKRLSEFLNYIVECKLAGAAHDATEGIIGHRVFGRPDTYNTGEDSIVRTEARILRQRLEHYFTEAGGSETIILEVPKGSYVPIFHPREVPPIVPPSGRSWRPFLLPLAVCLVAGGIGAWYLHRPVLSPSPIRPASGLVGIEASDAKLTSGFRWAKQLALANTYTGDAIGEWYESTAGTRHAFCMRDVAHQSLGASALGLSAHTRNMLRRFAVSISAERKWCGYWEINKDGFPAPADYQDDQHFWYCLPANFDIMQACYRQFLWTGDSSYFDSAFSNFYDRTVTDYVAAWDPNHDGLMESSPKARPRGIPSYYQEDPKPLAGGDLLAAEYKGYLVYASMQEHRGLPGSLSQKLSEEYREKAQAIRIRYNTEWWNPVQGRYYSLMLPDHSFHAGYIADVNVFALLFGLPEDGVKTSAALDSLEQNRPPFDQTFSYVPEILFRYGRKVTAYRDLLELMDPNFRGRGMPEVAFAVIGAITTGLMGISPDATRHLIETLPMLPNDLEWVGLTQLPVLQNEIDVRHAGTKETMVTNRKGPGFYWKASFAYPGPLEATGRAPEILLDGARVRASIEHRLDQRVISVTAPVRSGQTRTARLRD